MLKKKHPDYWKVKAVFFESQTVALTARVAALEARLAMPKADAKFAAVMRAAGLDPEVSYDLDDVAESIIPKQAGGA